MQKVKISRWGSPKIGYYTKLSHCKRNWDFSCKIVAPRNFFVFNGDFGGFQWGNFQNSEFAYYASKSGKCIKQTPTPPFGGDVGVKKWSQKMVEQVFVLFIYYFWKRNRQILNFEHFEPATKFEYIESVIIFIASILKSAPLHVVESSFPLFLPYP